MHGLRVECTGNGLVADGNVQIRRSTDGVDWQYAGEVWQEKPDWLVEAVARWYLTHGGEGTMAEIAGADGEPG